MEYHGDRETLGPVDYVRANAKPILGAYVTLSVLFLVGVLFVLDPIALADAPGEPLVHPLLGFLLSTALYVALFVWVDAHMRHPIKAALAVALSQLILVDMDFVLSGKRGMGLAAASAILLLVSWSLVGWVYQRLERSRVPGLPDAGDETP